MQSNFINTLRKSFSMYMPDCQDDSSGEDDGEPPNISDLLVFDVDGTITKWKGEYFCSLFKWFLDLPVDKRSSIETLIQFFKANEHLENINYLKQFFNYLNHKKHIKVMIATNNFVLPAQMIFQVLDFPLSKISDCSIYRESRKSKRYGICKAVEQYHPKRIIYFEDTFQHIDSVKKKNISNFNYVHLSHENLGKLLEKNPVYDDSSFENFLEKYLCKTDSDSEDASIEK